MKYEHQFGTDSTEADPVGADPVGTDPGGSDVWTPTESLEVLNRSAAVLVKHLDPKLVPLPEATAVMEAFIGLERLAVAGRILMSSRATEAGQWRRSGFSTPEEWLASKQGTSRGRAKADLGTSNKLGDLDATADAVRDGKLSAEQAGAIADAAAVNPSAEADLLDRAEQTSLAGLKEEAARRKAEREDQAAKEKRIRRERSVRTWTTGEGEWHLHAKGPAVDAAGFAKDLEALVDARFKKARKELPQDKWEKRDAYAFDALVGAGDEGGALEARSDRPKSSRPVKHLALLRVDLAALVRGNVTDGELCEIAGFGPVSVDAARNLLGDSLLKLVLTDGVDVQNVTHAGRGPRIAQEIALLWTQPKCCVTGCDNSRMLEVDHRIGYATNRVTELPNLNRPCSHHHDLKTYQGWDFAKERAPDGRLHLVAPDDPRHPHQRLPDTG